MKRRTAIILGAVIGLLGTLTAIFGLLSVTLEIISYPFRLPAVGLGMLFPGMQHLPGLVAILIILLANVVIWAAIGWGLHALLSGKGSGRVESA